MHSLAPNFVAASCRDSLQNLEECSFKQELFIEQLPEILNNLRQISLIEPTTEFLNRLKDIVVAPAYLKWLAIGNAQLRCDETNEGLHGR